MSGKRNIKPFAVGIDVGGTKIASGLVDRDGKISACFSTRAHSEKDPRFVIDAIEESYYKVLNECGVKKEEVEGVCLGFAGTVNGPEGIVLISSNLPAWHKMPLRDIVSERLGMPVILENDTNLCGLGEYTYGAGRGSQRMCYVTFSTGYGMGIIINGKLYVGATGTAGEIAHIVVDVGGPLCTCGKRGCLMTYASGVGISRMAYEKIDAGKETALSAFTTPDRKRIRGEVIAEAATQGDTVAREIINTAGYYFGVGLSIIVQIVNPELIVYGGGLSCIGEPIMKPALEGLKENTQPELLDSFQLKPWELGNQVGVIGAGARVFLEH